MINFDDRRFEVSNDKIKIKLTRTEFLITKFLHDLGTVGRREEIAKAAEINTTKSNILSVYIFQLRKKIVDLFDIQTIRGSGYDLIKK